MSCANWHAWAGILRTFDTYALETLCLSLNTSCFQAPVNIVEWATQTCPPACASSPSGTKAAFVHARACNFALPRPLDLNYFGFIQILCSKYLLFQQVWTNPYRVSWRHVSQQAFGPWQLVKKVLCRRLLVAMSSCEPSGTCSCTVPICSESEIHWACLHRLAIKQIVSFVVYRQST